jgi:hypothetical protein
MVQPDKAQMTIKCDACALHAGLLMLQIQTYNSLIFIDFTRQGWLSERA